MHNCGACVIENEMHHAAKCAMNAEDRSPAGGHLRGAWPHDAARSPPSPAGEGGEWPQTGASACAGPSFTCSTAGLESGQAMRLRALGTRGPLLYRGGARYCMGRATPGAQQKRGAQPTRATRHRRQKRNAQQERHDLHHGSAAPRADAATTQTQCRGTVMGD